MWYVPTANELVRMVHLPQLKCRAHVVTLARAILALVRSSSRRRRLSPSSSPLCDETAVAVSVTRETDGATDGGGGGSATWLEVVGADDDMGRIGGGPIGFFSLPSSHL